MSAREQVSSELTRFYQVVLPGTWIAGGFGAYYLPKGSDPSTLLIGLLLMTGLVTTIAMVAPLKTVFLNSSILVKGWWTTIEIPFSAVKHVDRLPSFTGYPIVISLYRSSPVGRRIVFLAPGFAPSLTGEGERVFLKLKQRIDDAHLNPRADV